MPPWLVPGPFPAEIPAEEGSFITEVLNLAESPEASLALVRVAPGVTTRLHAVEGIVERYILIRGSGLVEVAGRAAAVSAGDRVIIPAGVPQRITNTGEGFLEFHELCTPRFRPDAYRDLEPAASGL